MAKATWQGVVLAESDNGVVVEGNYYFPKDSVHNEYLQPSTTQTVCPWKGTSSYYNIVVDEQVNPDAAWTYPTPKEAAKEIQDHIAFWHGVQVEQ